MSLQMYKVRVLYYVKSHLYEQIDACPNREFAFERFVFYVRCALELGVDIRSCNIMKGKKSIKLFQNH